MGTSFVGVWEAEQELPELVCSFLARPVFYDFLSNSVGAVQLKLKSG